jgi:hypothetical protein
MRTTNLPQRLLRALAAVFLVVASAGAGAASPYFITVSGTPASITCNTTSFTIGSGLTASWNFAPGSSQQIVSSFYINGTLINSTLPQSLSGIPSPQSLPSLSSNVAYSATIPYSVSYIVMPVDPDTDGVSVTFTCGASGGTNFKISNVPGPSAVLQASPSSVAFPATGVGATSATSSVTITNNGTADATGVAVANSNTTDFAIVSNTCGTTLAAGASCALGVQFHPAVGGARSATIGVTRAFGAGVTIGLTGTGVTSLTMPAIAPFASQAVGTTSAPNVLTVTNGSASPVTVSGVTSSNPAEFPVTTTCASVGAGATCTISVAFAPSGTGTRTSTITVTSDGLGSPQTIIASGTGTGGAAPGQLSVPATVTFGTQTVGTTSAASTLTVTNTGGSPVTVSGVASSAPAEFTVAGTTCTTVAAGATCTIGVTFTPAAAGARSATITVTSNGAGSPQAIAASGTGSTVATPGQLTVPASVAFPAQNVGSTSAPSVVTLTNTGGSPVNVSGIASSVPSEFAIVSNACATVAAGASCTFSVAFTPAAAGARAATITVTSNGTGSPQAINATGTGTSVAGPGQLSLPASVDFGTAVPGTAGITDGITLVNVGASAVQVSSVASSNPGEFGVTQSTCATVNPGASCAVTIAFTPAALGDRTGTLTVISNGTGSPQAAALHGVGVAAPPATIDIIEYYHAEWDHYFVTGIPDEIAKLDAGVFAGWARTGLKFKAYAAGTAGSANVCRFFSTSFGERSSHFYTPFVTECGIVKQNPNWMLESEAVFAIPVPDLAGNCPAGTTPVYRYYNNGQGGAPNHRYTTDLSLRPGMTLVRGWIPEGYGDLGVIMCAPL